MRFSEDDHDIGAIIITIIVTVVIGALCTFTTARTVFRLLTCQLSKERYQPSSPPNHRCNICSSK
jgi:hypothetical protein